MDRRPVLCAECHASNALGAPGVVGIPNLSKAIHDKHSGEVPQPTAAGVSDFSASSLLTPFWPLVLLLTASGVGLIFLGLRRR